VIVPMNPAKQPKVFTIHSLELVSVGFGRAIPFTATLTNAIPAGEIALNVMGCEETAPLAEPLTEREVAVLRLLGSSLSLREIGQELFVSANTVKTHTQAIYRKLGVSARHDAVVRGNQRGIR